MDRPCASVLIPTHNPGPGIARVLHTILAQRTEFAFEVVIVDSCSRPADVAVMRSFPVRFEQIAQLEFGHGRTRNLLGRLALGDLLLYLSQALPASVDWMSSLVAALDDPRVAGAYARQIPTSGADPLIRFFLAETYGPAPVRRRLRSDRAAGIRDIFFSNVSSVVRRTVWERVPFRADVIMSEDQYWAYDVLSRGYDILYHPAAKVYHSHNYSLATVFRRNWQSGASLRGLIADQPREIAARGVRYVAAEALYLIRSGRATWLPYMLAYEASKSAGFALGTRFTRDTLPSPRPSHTSPMPEKERRRAQE